MSKYAGTQTEKNLLAAFAGESEARNKYTYFASKAKKEGYEQIAALFLKTADNEKEHAKLWFKELEGIGDTKENLKAAAGGENYEWTDMYEGFAKMKKDSTSWQKSSDLWLQSRSTMRKDTGLSLRMLRLHRYLKRVKLRFGSAETAVIS